MIFKGLKESFRTRRSRSRPPSALPTFNMERASEGDRFEREERIDRLQETMNVFSRLGHSISSKNIKLPPIPSFKPLNLSNLDIFKSKDDPVSDVPAEIRRKPCPVNPEAFDTATLSPSMTPAEILHHKFRAFDPCAPVTNPLLHMRAREALKRRYESKFTIDFDPPAGITAREYNFMWCDEGELDLKVLQDIVWVRERYAQARKGEPTDEDVIRWYDAERFDVGTESVTEGSFR
ncbi:uncharacterized protein LY89DRAFT_667711 [Mollisia scopiformis]|uniref:Uncharacterized protein n=1 Tax=Mollisia scopiformis TaxID=149040 RepID=A0A194XFX4_MOLSC|nr:uncharacterized protein LY89DRAFT_667711 [Mollisia scopiformis]KUJ19029.1 hypothetical protein LY89DRAFT_667711 [Mollisia scopiformis]